jgi:calcium-activated chloride channel regulator 3/4
MKNEVISRLRRLMGSLSMLTIAALLVVPAVVQAGDHWLSRVTVKSPTQPDTIMSAKQAASNSLATVMKTSSTAVFGITISLDAIPQGDDDWTVDDGANDADQRAYEERIKEFARAVYQSTNGGHKIGMVTIYRDGALANSVDVLWNENCSAYNGPRANISGFGVAGKRIWMCTNWPGAAALMPTPKGSGYTLAHEWGHYTYGLYDEYAAEQCTAANIAANTCRESTPRATDTYAIPSIMGCQWMAAGGSCLGVSYSGPIADFLEFSTQNIHPFRADSTGTNAQKRVFGESAWETLTRDSATDPKFSWLSERTQYTTLTAPTDPNWIVNNDESTALSELDIRWVGDQLMDMSIDVSGSMSGTPLANAKTGANLLIDQIQPGTAIGVSSFATNVVRNFAITDIPDPDTGVRASAKAAVNALIASGLTSMYDGLIFSLNDLLAFDPNRTGVVYLLSDGGDNDSTATESSVISAYQAAGIPIIAFAYGSYAPTGTLLNLANSTGGAFFQSPTTLPEIQVALLSAEAKFSDNVLLASARVSVAAGTTTQTIPMDSTLASAMINLSYTGSQTDFSFSLLRPDGTDSGVTFTCEGSTSCSATLDETFFASDGYGDYQVQLVNNIGIPQDVTVLVSATPSGAETYDIAVGFSSSTVNYPTDMVIRATVTKKGVALAGLDVVAEVTDPSGSSFDVPLLDDGMGADILADDGTYSASISYTANGSYSAVVTASNAAGRLLPRRGLP